MGFFNEMKDYPFQILNTKYFKKDLEDLHKVANITAYDELYLNMTRDDQVFELDNPGVTYIPIVLRTQPTIFKIIYHQNVTELARQNKYASAEIKYGYGDGVFDTTSLMLASLKWAHEFETQSVKGAKPMKILDFCSNFNQRDSVYDKEDSSSEFEILKNEFIGMKCDCMKDKTTD